jgi:DNA-binding PadR family transcriptional regulator
MSPVFGHGQLRLYLLSLLDESPRHGYEVIRALEDRFEGMYAPSAGTIYPRLARLEEEGLVVRSDEGRKAVYRITDAGRAELAARRADVHELEAELTRSVRRMAEQVRAEVSGSAKDLRAELKAAAREARRHARDSDRHDRWDEEPPRQGRGPNRDVERLIQRFREEARHAVRSRGVTEQTVAQVREALDDALRTIERALSGERESPINLDVDGRTGRDDSRPPENDHHISDHHENRHDNRHENGDSNDENDGRREDRP